MAPAQRRSRGRRAPAAAAERPNILFIITDQQSQCAMSSSANPYVRTPAMDSLAADGVSFTESYSTYPVCSPARSSFFTSRMPHETGVRVNGLPIAPGIPTMGEVFRAAGYNLMSQAVGIASKWNRDDVRFYLHSYYRLVEDVDRQVGRVLSALRSAGLYDNTLIILTSDHGEGLGSHRWAQKAAFWEETARVPVIVAGAGVERRGIQDSRSLVSGLDILPTICDYAAVRTPALIRGRSLRGAISGAGFDRPFVVSELSEYGDKRRQGRMLRTRRHKYIVFNGGERPEQLFDLELDPGEICNLARRASAATVLGERRALMAKWVEETGDDFQ
ncbi:MAG: sulfatase-like hydrolase/transferase [Acidobacteriota bacterium]